MALAGADGLVVQSAEAATPALTAQSQSRGTKVFVNSSKKVKSLSAIRIKVKDAKSSELSYRVNGKGGYVKSGKVAGKKGRDARTIQVKLGGSLAEGYDVYYRANLKGYGWTDWAKNNAKAGDAYKLNITNYQVKLVEKGAKAPGATYAPYVSKVTGDSVADQRLAKTVSKGKISTLDKAFRWVVGNVSYQATSRPNGISSYSKSRIAAEAKDAFGSRKGNCYTYAVGTYALAKYLGYDARPVAGTMTYSSTSGEKTAHMSWAEIVVNGTTWVYDAMTQHTQDRDFSKIDRYHFYAPKGQTTFVYTAA